MKHRRLLGIAGAVSVLALVVFLSVAAASSKRPTHAQTAATISAPKVPNAAAIRRKYHGQKITFVGDSVGNGHIRDMKLAKRFTRDTGIKVSVVPHPAASDQSYAQLVDDRALDPRDRVGLELDVAVRVEALDRADQAEQAVRDEVVLVDVRGQSAAEPSGDVLDERRVREDQAVSGRLVLVLLVLAPEGLGLVLGHEQRIRLRAAVSLDS